MERASGPSHLDRLRNDLNNALTMAKEAGDEDGVRGFQHLLRHCEAAQSEAMLTYAEVTAIVARADGRLFISDAELRAIDGLLIAHEVVDGGYVFTVSASPDSDAQA